MDASPIKSTVPANSYVQGQPSLTSRQLPCCVCLCVNRDFCPTTLSTTMRLDQQRAERKHLDQQLNSSLKTSGVVKSVNVICRRVEIQQYPSTEWGCETMSLCMRMASTTEPLGTLQQPSGTYPTTCTQFQWQHEQWPGSAPTLAGWLLGCLQLASSFTPTLCNYL